MSSLSKETLSADHEGWLPNFLLQQTAGKYLLVDLPCLKMCPRPQLNRLLGSRRCLLDSRKQEWECKGMSPGAKRVLDAFDSLSAEAREEVLGELLRRAAHSDHMAPSDEELVAAADNVFLELDRRES